MAFPKLNKDWAEEGLLSFPVSSYTLYTSIFQLFSHKFLLLIKLHLTQAFIICVYDFQIHNQPYLYPHGGGHCWATPVLGRGGGSVG